MERLLVLGLSYKEAPVDVREATPKKDSRLLSGSSAIGMPVPWTTCPMSSIGTPTSLPPGTCFGWPPDSRPWC
jgi:hypothetical protein